MKKLITKYSGAIFLYSVIVFGVFILNARFRHLNEIEKNNNTIVAIGMEE